MEPKSKRVSAAPSKITMRLMVFNIIRSGLKINPKLDATHFNGFKETWPYKILQDLASVRH